MIEQNHGLALPRALQQDFSQRVQYESDRSGKEMTLSSLWQLFRHAYGLHDTMPLLLHSYSTQSAASGELLLSADLMVKGKLIAVTGRGNGLLSSAVDALRSAFHQELTILDYHEHTLGQHSDSRSAAYLCCALADGSVTWGVGIDQDVARASLQALLHASAAQLFSASQPESERK